MGVETLDLLYTASTWVIPVLLAITLHEAAHGFVAWRLGDDTAYRAGRVTFNPFAPRRHNGHGDTAGACLLLHARALPVRLGQAGAGQLRPPRPAAPGHGAGRRRRAGRQPAAGDRSAALLFHVAVLLARGRPERLVRPQLGERHSDQPDPGDLQHAASCRPWTAGGSPSGSCRARSPCRLPDSSAMGFSSLIGLVFVLADAQSSGRRSISTSSTGWCWQPIEAILPVFLWLAGLPSGG